MTTKTIRYCESINGNFAVVPVSFIKPGIVRRWALVDPGAAYSIFKSEVADELGINLYKVKPNPLIVGNGQVMSAYIHKLNIRICGKRIS